jgi:acyl transferase domain-containing protein/NAD(P)H-dependent flavin oxidoreductase YrpB (nitropropane dioxygenase family)/NAD(P)-dependent dehydrogenase (short-subunit alcohol dehydrogenase family)
LGVLDPGPGFDAAAVFGAIERAAAFLPDQRFGIRLEAGELRRYLDLSRPEALTPTVVVGDGGAAVDWADLRALLAGAGRAAIAEVTSRRVGLLALRAGFDCLIVSGNEACGRGSDESSFILLQAILGAASESAGVWVRGGIGPVVAAGCVAAGAQGVVLDGAVLLARESPLDAETRARIAVWDGVESSVFHLGPTGAFRCFVAPGSDVLRRLQSLSDPGGEISPGRLREVIGWGSSRAWPVGQDSALAERLARRFVTVGGIVREVERAIDEGVAAARAVRPLAEGSALARSHGTRLPIVQGPMTRVSDRAPFARAVADAGGLPLLALALMRGEEVLGLLTDVKQRLEGQPWGVGILGFISPELRHEQNEAVLAAKPPFALIAGGRPDQARPYEDAGIPTYLHAPSPGLLRQFLKEGARRFVLEGRECGGHVGPRSSFLLWEQAAAIVVDAIEEGIDPDTIHLLYAGGVHDARSSALVSAVSAPLAARGVRVGALMGTAYLFTREAVETGAIVEGFQREALECSTTVLLETGPGHVVRVSPTAFADRFDAIRLGLIKEGRTAEEVRSTLEQLNVGRLRIAAKGVDRRGGAGAPLAAVSLLDQKDQGLYMLGEAATLRSARTTIAELHREIATGGPALLVSQRGLGAPPLQERPRPSDIAIVGISALMPGATSARQFWANTLQGHDSITEVPADRWDWRIYFDPDAKAPDRITSRWGGFLPEVPFDPLEYGMPPASVPSIEPLQLLTLEAVRAALADAGYRDRPFPRERTAVVLGAGGGAAQLAMGYAFRSYLPLLDTVMPGAGSEALNRLAGLLPEWSEDSFPGILLNVAAGRVANRFDLGGANYTVDAACGSSLAAAAQAVRELETGAADMVLLGGADTVQNPFTYLAFSKTHAFSARGRCRPFDSKADGIVISEAVAVVVLKRLADAERDGDRIYAVIKGIGASSDGRAKGLTAPHFEGQVRALARAYEKAGISPETVGYVEAHGTGTAAGDLAEVQALTEVFAAAGAKRGGSALGSVKSMIGHTKCAAGLAGLINAALALHHRVLPPTIGIEEPNPRARFAESPFRPNTRARPWLRNGRDQPRRAGVSAFGFGGTNFHAVLEAYEGDPAPTPPSRLDWPVELFAWQAPDRAELLATLDTLERALEAGSAPSLCDLSHAVLTRFGKSSVASGQGSDTPNRARGPRLAVVAHSIEDLRAKLKEATRRLQAGSTRLHDPLGIDYADAPLYLAGHVAFLFPGQGSQHPDMLGELAIDFPEIVRAFEEVDRALASCGRPAISHLVFPSSPIDEDEAQQQKASLAAIEVAQPALGAASAGLLRVMLRVGLEPDVVAGHSFGELTALHAAGVLSLEKLAVLAEARGRFLKAALGDEIGAMAAIGAGVERVRSLLEGIGGVVAANRNGPAQTVVSGLKSGVSLVVARARQEGLRAQELSGACAFHSPLVEKAVAPLAEFAAGLGLQAPAIPVFSNVSATPYDGDPSGFAHHLGEHVTSPVRFAEMIEAMYHDGARVFVEVGPGTVLTALVGSILGDRAHEAVACEPTGRKGLAGLLGTLARLVVAGAPLALARLTESRAATTLTWSIRAFEPSGRAVSATTWYVDGNRARPAFGQEPARFGPGPALPPPDSLSIAPPLLSNGQASFSLPPGLAALARGDASSDEVFSAFQKMMRTFLDVQQSSALAFLGARSPASSPAPLNGHARAADARTESPPAKHPSPGRAELNERREATPASTAGFSVEESLLSIVRDRTGFPVAMLGLNLDLEADLGIDSIKRVEILGTLRETLPWSLNGSEAELMEELARARTLGAIIERMSAHVTSARHPEHGASSANDTRSSPESLVDIGETAGPRRLILEPISAPLAFDEPTAGLPSGGLVLVTDDRCGVAKRICDRLEREGARPVRLMHSSGEFETRDTNVCLVDLGAPEAIARLTEHVRSVGVVTGIVHALPLRDAREPSLDAADWAERMSAEVRGLYLLARAFGGDLTAKNDRVRSRLIAATAMGGCFASLPSSGPEFFAGHGAIAGTVKTLVREWPVVVARVVDFDRSDGPAVIAGRLFDELVANDDRPEVGYYRGQRIALGTVPAELDASDRAGIELAEGEPILVTGGARGITAEIAYDFARRWRPRLLVIGSSGGPDSPARPELDALGDPADLKAELLRTLSAGGRVVAPVELERAYHAVRREREIRANLDRLRKTGSEVEYRAVDVRDEPALAHSLDVWRRRHGPLRGLIHGAGVIHDKLVRDKTPESFDRVIDTKLGGALALARLIDPAHLRFAAFFSSVAGRFGNRGQADYAAANEAINKLALWLDRRWPCRVVSMIWGPWSGVGMVSELERHLGRQGLSLLDPAQGRTRLSDELRLGTKGDVEVIVAGALGALASSTRQEAGRHP